MKTDKAQLTVGRLSLLERTILVAQKAFLAPNIIVCGRPNHPFGIADVVPAKGPVSGLASAIHFLNFNLPTSPELDLIVLPVDLPLLNEGILQSLLQESRLHQQDVTKYLGHNLPVVFRLNKSVCNAIEKQIHLEGGACSIKAISNGLSVCELSTTSDIELSLYNANTPEDWDHIVKKYLSILTSYDAYAKEDCNLTTT